MSRFAQAVFGAALAVLAGLGTAGAQDQGGREPGGQQPAGAGG